MTRLIWSPTFSLRFSLAYLLFEAFAKMAGPKLSLLITLKDRQTVPKMTVDCLKVGLFCLNTRLHSWDCPWSIFLNLWSSRTRFTISLIYRNVVNQSVKSQDLRIMPVDILIKLKCMFHLTYFQAGSYLTTRDWYYLEASNTDFDIWATMVALLGLSLIASGDLQNRIASLMQLAIIRGLEFGML